ncbi:MAG: GTPase Era [Halieaceae bacterium]|jgi:GTP-binding protein Era|nr:GTPase Era [Halieaceae bacterium]
MADTQTRCGYVAIVGRPNVGKSTLLNYLLGQKLSITSRKPQTTRHQVMGIKTEGDNQIIFVDTPGIHADGGKALNRVMNRAATSALADVDLVLFLIDRNRWTDEDELVLQSLQHVKAPVVLVINKQDLLDDKTALLPFTEGLLARYDFAAVIPVSALRRQQLDRLEQFIIEHIPEGPHHFPEDQITDRSERFLAAELIREKIVRQLGDELPYATAVEIESFKQEGKVLHIHGLILVERQGQKRIMIGEGGSRLRSIGTEARKDMETAFDSKVMLKLWVKVRSGWSDDARALRSLGVDDRGE